MHTKELINCKMFHKPLSHSPPFFFGFNVWSLICELDLALIQCLCGVWQQADPAVVRYGVLRDLLCPEVRLISVCCIIICAPVKCANVIFHRVNLSWWIPPRPPPPAPARNAATGCVKRSSCKLNVFFTQGADEFAGILPVSSSESTSSHKYHERNLIMSSNICYFFFKQTSIRINPVTTYTLHKVGKSSDMSEYKLIGALYSQINGMIKQCTSLVTHRIHFPVACLLPRATQAGLSSHGWNHKYKQAIITCIHHLRCCLPRASVFCQDASRHLLLSCLVNPLIRYLHPAAAWNSLHPQTSQWWDGGWGGVIIVRTV